MPHRSGHIYALDRSINGQRLVAAHAGHRPRPYRYKLIQIGSDTHTDIALINTSY